MRLETFLRWLERRLSRPDGSKIQPFFYSFHTQVLSHRHYRLLVAMLAPSGQAAKKNSVPD